MSAFQKLKEQGIQELNLKEVNILGGRCYYVTKTKCKAVRNRFGGRTWECRRRRVRECIA